MQPQAGPWAEHADLDRFGGDAVPQHLIATGIETLKDGDHDFEVAGAVLDMIDEHKVLRVSLYVLDLERRPIEHVYWLNRQPSVNSFLAEMASLGFPAQTWGGRQGQTPLSVAIPAAALQMRGMRFRATKTSRFVEAQPAGGGKPAREAKTYHDLRILAKQRAQPAAQPAAPARQPTPGGADFLPAGTTAARPNDIPF